MGIKFNSMKFTFLIVFYVTKSTRGTRPSILLVDILWLVFHFQKRSSIDS